MFETMKGMGRDESEVEASASLSLLIAQIGNHLQRDCRHVCTQPLRRSPHASNVVQVLVLGIVTGLSAAGLDGVAVVPTIAAALLFFQVPSPPVLVLLIAIDPILTLPAQRQPVLWPWRSP